jgi:hypothetical protein
MLETVLCRGKAPGPLVLIDRPPFIRLQWGYDSHAESIVFSWRLIIATGHETLLGRRYPAIGHDVTLA